MKKVPVGAEPKKMVILVALLGLAGYLFYTNVLSSPAAPGGSTKTAAGPAPGSIAATLRNAVQPPAEAPVRPGISQSNRKRQTQADFKPSLRPRRPEERLDPTTVDPTLRLDLLARLENVKIERVERSLFDFGAAAPKAAEPKIEVKPAAKVKKMVGPEPPPPPAPPAPPPPKPVAPPVPLKFFGYQIAKAEGMRRTFCLDGEEILTPLEGETIKGRYKIVRIGLTSVVVEDLQFKQQQTLPIEEAPQGS